MGRASTHRSRPRGARCEGETLTANLAGLLAFNVLLLGAGIGVTAAAGWWRGGRALVRSLGVSHLAGVAVYGVVAQLLYVCGASLARWQVVAICLVASGGSVLGLRRSAPVPRTILTRWRLVALPLVALLALLAVDLWFQPLWAYDSWTFWTPKAHALWALDGLDAGWFTSADLTSKDYPLLLPSIEAAGFRFTGYEVSLLDLQSLLFFGAFLRAIYELSTERARPAVLWAVLAMLAAAPSVVDQLAAAEADIPVAVLFASAGLCAAVWLRERRNAQLVVATTLAAGATATKVEGLGFAIALFAVLAAVAAADARWDAVRALGAGVAAVVVGIAPWRIWLSRHGVPNQGSLGRLGDVTYLAQHLSRVPLAIGYLLAKLLDPRAWLLVLPLFAIASWDAMRKARRRPLVFALATATAAFASLVLAYWSTRLGLRYQLATSGRRTVTGVVFFCAAVTPLLSEPSGGS